MTFLFHRHCILAFVDCEDFKIRQSLHSQLSLLIEMVKQTQLRKYNKSFSTQFLGDKPTTNAFICLDFGSKYSCCWARLMVLFLMMHTTLLQPWLLPFQLVLLGGWDNGRVWRNGEHDGFLHALPHRWRLLCLHQPHPLRISQWKLQKGDFE